MKASELVEKHGDSLQFRTVRLQEGNGHPSGTACVMALTGDSVVAFIAMMRRQQIQGETRLDWTSSKRHVLVNADEEVELLPEETS